MPFTWLLSELIRIQRSHWLMNRAAEDKDDPMQLWAAYRRSNAAGEHLLGPLLETTGWGNAAPYCRQRQKMGPVGWTLPIPSLELWMSRSKPCFSAPSPAVCVSSASTWTNAGAKPTLNSLFLMGEKQNQQFLWSTGTLCCVQWMW